MPFHLPAERHESLALEDLDQKTATGAKMIDSKIERQFAEHDRARLIRRRHARQIGGHVREHDIGPPSVQAAREFGKRPVIGKIALQEIHPGDGFDRQQIEREHPSAAAAALYRDLAPRTGRGAEIHHHRAGAQQMVAVVDLHEFVGGAGAIALGVGAPHERIGKMLAHPRLAGLAAFHIRVESGPPPRIHEPPMSMPELTSVQRHALRARAHTLHPVVTIAGNGLGAGVIAELERSIQAHELIKVRIQGAERARRAALLAEVCEALEAAPVQHIGNILIIWRPRKEKPEAKKTAAAPRKMTTAKSAATFAATARRAARARAVTGQKHGKARHNQPR